MQYNSEANDLDCVSEVLAICGGATITDYPLSEITRRFNASLDRYFSLAFESDGRANFDDINETSPPIDTQNIVSGTNRYKFSAFTETILSVLKIEILNSAGKGIYLIPENFDNLGIDNPGNQSGRISGMNADTFQELYINAPSGTPTHYIKYGDFVYLRPKPDYSLADALKAYFNRPASYMAHDDTTKVPGVPVIHHTALCRMTALPWLVEKGLPHKNDVANQILVDEKSIQKHFSRRDKDVVQRLQTIKQNNR